MAGALEMLTGRPPEPGRSLTEMCKTRSEAHRSSHRTIEDELSAGIQECMLRCLDCQSMCLRTVEHYWRLKDAKLVGPDTRVLLDCSEICGAAARFLLRGSEACRRLCLLCAELCRSCAGQCIRVGDGTEMAACALACQQCAECCERIAGATAWPHQVEPGVLSPVLGLSKTEA
jgi:hypothetical protein